MAVSRLVTMIKSITGKEVIKRRLGLRKEMWGSSLWTSGYYASTVGKYGNEETVSRYVKEQGREDEYVQLHKDQLRLL